MLIKTETINIHVDKWRGSLPIVDTDAASDRHPRFGPDLEVPSNLLDPGPSIKL